MDQVAVTPIEIARLRFDLAQAYGPGAVAGSTEETTATIPVQAFHLALPGRSVLVDAPHYDEADTPEIYLLPGYQAPPPLATQLRSRGIAPEDITDVVVTHLHFDHYGALTRRQGDGLAPTFPNARHYLGRGDWPPDPEEAGPLAERTVAVLERLGLLTLTEADGDAVADIDLGGGIRLVPAPGESPGHQLVRAQVAADVVYVVGDLFHHTVELRGGGPDVRWVDAEKMAASKRRLTARAADDRARVYASHMAGVHKVARSCGGFKWVRVTA
ncbi:MAG TPA: MBL fold metallo-hydrolase [Trueperaceae bacterium]|nr:MBL fold metallo-hydrolase [Trueperaceae bacterium]